MDRGYIDDKGTNATGVLAPGLGSPPGELALPGESCYWFPSGAGHAPPPRGSGLCVPVTPFASHATVPIPLGKRGH